MIALPSYIDTEAWSAFVDMRKGNKKIPFTDYAQKLILKELMKFHAEGFDPNNSLEQSIINGWRGVFRGDMRTGLRPLAVKHVETFKERDTRLGRERWEQMTGQRHPENMLSQPVDVYTLDLLEVLQ